VWRSVHGCVEECLGGLEVLHSNVNVHSLKYAMAHSAG
jgi:hypothetical protein